MTQEQKHTPAPWKTDGRNVTQADFVNGNHIARVSYDPTGHAAPQELETLANAHLISAAPELLNALKDHRKALWLAMDELWSAWLKGKKSYTKDQQKYMDFFQSELDKADAAILKAEGGAE